MDQFEFDDTNTSGIWWSTNVAIRDACIELKVDTGCSNSTIAKLLETIAKSIEKDGL